MYVWLFYDSAALGRSIELLCVSAEKESEAARRWSGREQKSEDQS
jgi:hypothetical protein